MSWSREQFERLARKGNSRTGEEDEEMVNLGATLISDTHRIVSATWQLLNARNGQKPQEDIPPPKGEPA